MVGVWKEVPGGATTDVGLRACRFGDRVWLFLKGYDFPKGQNRRIYYNSVDMQGYWGSWREVPGSGSTNMRLAVCTFEKLRLFHTGDDSSIYMNSMDYEQRWSGWHKVPGGGSTSYPLAAELHHVPYSSMSTSKVYVFHRRIKLGDNYIYIYIIIT
ncbi:MAG TPA: hypothetical protein PLX30_06310 [Methanothrix sp.]|nr:hypothetical protein [Methanothrix sp.]